MFVTITILIMVVLSLLAIILGQDFVSSLVNVALDNESFVDGVPSTFEVIGQDFLFTIDTSVLIDGAIVMLFVIIGVALITGITVLGSGLSSANSRVIVMITAYIGLWTTLSVTAFNLIVQIEVFGAVIYIALTIGYSFGVMKNLSAGGD